MGSQCGGGSGNNTAAPLRLIYIYNPSQAPGPMWSFSGEVRPGSELVAYVVRGCWAVKKMAAGRSRGGGGSEIRRPLPKHIRTNFRVVRNSNPEVRTARPPGVSIAWVAGSHLQREPGVAYLRTSGYTARRRFGSRPKYTSHEAPLEFGSGLGHVQLPRSFFSRTVIKSGSAPCVPKWPPKTAKS